MGEGIGSATAPPGGVFDRATRTQLRLGATRAAGYLRLPFRRQIWRGTGGNWQGAGTGTSIDFQDHRQYLPGDDPKHINWQAYARTGHYTMKLYREEVSPAIDLLIDGSASMFVHEEKAKRVLELLHFIVESALAAGAMLRCYASIGGRVEPVRLEALRADGWEPPVPVMPDREAEGRAKPPDLSLVPWRSNSMRIVLSDLLFPGAPEGILAPMAQARSLVLIFCPWCEAEAEPEWLGNVELRDCEGAGRLKLRFTDREIERYRTRYRQHFGLWRESCAKRGFVFGRVASEPDLRSALLKEPMETGLVELCN